VGLQGLQACALVGSAATWHGARSGFGGWAAWCGCSGGGVLLESDCRRCRLACAVAWGSVKGLLHWLKIDLHVIG
jgi:hypothetical protein